MTKSLPSRGEHVSHTPTRPARRRSRPLASLHEPRQSSDTKFLVIWWMSKSPYAAVFANRVAAEAAANVRNALLITIKGKNPEVEQVVDWYRRDERGRPMPAEWRELMGHLNVPWRPRPSAGEHGIQTDLLAPREAAEA